MKPRTCSFIFGIAAAASIASGSAWASFEVTSHTIDGGGGRSTGATFAVTGTIAQADADPLQPSISGSGRFSLRGGFWMSSDNTLTPTIFADGFE